MSLIDNLGYVKSASYYPCALPNPVLLIEAAGLAIGPVLLSAASFGCNDIVKMRAGISPWHSRGIKMLINGAIPPAEKDAVGKIYKFLIPLEKLLFVWFVADLTTEFFARWHSQAFKLGACGVPSSQCSYGGNLATWVGGEKDHPRPISYSTDWTNGNCVGGGGARFAVPRGWYWNAHFSITPKPIFNNQQISYCDTFLTRVVPSQLQFPVHRTEPPWFGNTLTAMDQRSGNNDISQYEEYEMSAATDVPAIGVGGSCIIELSDRPLFDKPISPVNCLGEPMKHLPS